MYLPPVASEYMQIVLVIQSQNTIEMTEYQSCLKIYKNQKLCDSYTITKVQYFGPNNLPILRHGKSLSHSQSSKKDLGTF